MPEVFTVDPVANDSAAAQTSIGVDLSSIAGQLAESAPSVQEHVIAAHAEKQASAPIDSYNQPFDPAIHSSDSDGNGIKTQAGKWRRKRGKGSATSAAKTSTLGQSESASGPSAAQQAATATGIACAEMTIGTCTMVFGPEWQARTIKDETGNVLLDERAYMSKTYADYCAAKGIKDIPPGVALTLSLLAYAAPRFAEPETRERTGTMREWFTCKIASWKVRKELKKRGIVGASVKVHRVGQPVRGGKFQILVNGEVWKG